ncbi:hypothetical protein FPV67DRAFT_1454801 [Lyophyllum atratum]|nr:hypothetical protein FPV67DRAFT_1454801 [Lyophyllum atratum]
MKPKRGGKTKSRSTRGKKAETKSRRTRGKKAETLELLAKPLTAFRFEPPLTHPTWKEWENQSKEYGLRFRAGEEIKIGNVDWVRVEAYRRADGSVVGYLLIPPRYYPQWRHLLWGGFWHETMWEIWEEETEKIKAKRRKKTKLDDWVLLARRHAALRAVWYRSFQCRIVEELLGIDIGGYGNGTRDSSLRFFNEFGIRDYRAFMFDPIEGMHPNDAFYLTLDPTSPKNVEMFERGSLDPFLLNPPLDDDWLGGEVPFPNPRAEFVALCLKHGPHGEIEPLPLRPEEGLEHLHGVRLWECAPPKSNFYSRNYVDYASGKGVDPAHDRRKYLTWLIERVWNEEMEPVDWSQEVSSLSLEFDMWEPYKSAIERCIDGEVDLDECLDSLLQAEPDEEEPGELSDEEAILHEVTSVLEQLEELEGGLDIDQAREALGNILGVEYGTIINTLIDSALLDPDGEGMQDAEGIRNAAMMKWFDAKRADSDHDEQDADLDQEKDIESRRSSPMNLSNHDEQDADLDQEKEVVSRHRSESRHDQEKDVVSRHHSKSPQSSDMDFDIALPPTVVRGVRLARELLPAFSSTFSCQRLANLEPHAISSSSECATFSARTLVTISGWQRYYVLFELKFVFKLNFASCLFPPPPALLPPSTRTTHHRGTRRRTARRRIAGLACFVHRWAQPHVINVRCTRFGYRPLAASGLGQRAPDAAIMTASGGGWGVHITSEGTPAVYAVNENPATVYADNAPPGHASPYCTATPVTASGLGQRAPDVVVTTASGRGAGFIIIRPTPAVYAVNENPATVYADNAPPGHASPYCTATYSRLSLLCAPVGPASRYQPTSCLNWVLGPVHREFTLAWASSAQTSVAQVLTPPLVGYRALERSDERRPGTLPRPGAATPRVHACGGIERSDERRPSSDPALGWIPGIRALRRESSRYLPSPGASTPRVHTCVASSAQTSVAQVLTPPLVGYRALERSDERRPVPAFIQRQVMGTFFER